VHSVRFVSSASQGSFCSQISPIPVFRDLDAVLFEVREFD
jgi:hypothetical protein